MTPNQHYEKAAALMARVHEMKNAALPISVALTAQAHVHALLAQCPMYDDEFDPAEYPERIKDFIWSNVKARMIKARPATGGRL